MTAALWLEKLRAGTLSALPPGISEDYAAGFFERHRRALLDTLVGQCPRPTRIRFRAGLPEVCGTLCHQAFEHNIPVLVSASRLWKKDHFQLPKHPGILDLDTALDSAGFTAMTTYGGQYPWTPAEYVDLAFSYRWTWWSAMDYCVEPQIAGDPETVRSRVERTANTLFQLLWLVDIARNRAWAADARTGRAATSGYNADYVLNWMRDPMPILQGWRPEDYRRSIDLTAEALENAGRSWPEMVGVGSVCRRPMAGETGVERVIGELDRHLPRGVGLHLFGVKSGALTKLATHPRIVSADSMAWDFRNRKAAHAGGTRNRVDGRAAQMVAWYHRQLTALASGECEG